jgi:hypothetical protein
MTDLQGLVARAVEALLPHVPPGAPSLVERTHAALWPYVAVAVAQAPPDTAGQVEAPETRDKRAKPWQYTVRFWEAAPTGAELVAETDPAVMWSTGELPGIVSLCASEMHEGAPIPELSRGAVKERLPQLRNNLGRAGSAVLRVEYAVGGVRYLCQVDVIRLAQTPL